MMIYTFGKYGNTLVFEDTDKRYTNTIDNFLKRGFIINDNRYIHPNTNKTYFLIHGTRTVDDVSVEVEKTGFYTKKEIADWDEDFFIFDGMLQKSKVTDVIDITSNLFLSQDIDQTRRFVFLDNISYTKMMTEPIFQLQIGEEILKESYVLIRNWDELYRMNFYFLVSKSGVFNP